MHNFQERILQTNLFASWLTYHMFDFLISTCIPQGWPFWWGVGRTGTKRLDEFNWGRVGSPSPPYFFKYVVGPLQPYSMVPWDIRSLQFTSPTHTQSRQSLPLSPLPLQTCPKMWDSCNPPWEVCLSFPCIFFIPFRCSLVCFLVTTKS